MWESEDGGRNGRVDDDVDASTGLPHEQGGAPESPAPADADEAVASDQNPGSDGSDDDAEPVILSINDEDPDEDVHEGAVEIVLDESADEPPAPSPDDATSVPRARLLELGRDKMQLEAEVRRLQTELYQTKTVAQDSSAQIQDLQDQLARKQSEFQNYRRRVEREREEALRYAEGPLLEELLPALDNFQLALATSAQDDAGSEFRKGVVLIHKQLLDVLSRRDLAPIEVVGKPFDPNFHEGITRAYGDDYPAEHVRRELRSGYMYKDRLLRAAMVEVAMGPEPNTTQDPGAASDGPPRVADEATPASNPGDDLDREES